MGTSPVTFGLFFADAGTAISGRRAHHGRRVRAWAGWLAGMFRRLHGRLCARQREGLAFGRPSGPELVPFLAFSLAALGVAAAFAPSWDSYILQTSAGTTESLTAGNVFSNPAPVIAGNVAVMVVFVAVVVAAALWRPVLHGTALLAGAVMPMVAQAISAVVQIGEHTSPTMFGISPSAAAQSGLTITSGSHACVLDLLRLRARTHSRGWVHGRCTTPARACLLPGHLEFSDEHRLLPHDARNAAGTLAGRTGATAHEPRRPVVPTDITGACGIRPWRQFVWLGSAPASPPRVPQSRWRWAAGTEDLTMACS